MKITCVALQEASKSLHYSFPSCGSRGVKIITVQRAEKSFAQGKWEYKGLPWVQGTMLEVQQQRGAVTRCTAPQSLCPEGSLKVVKLGGADQWTAAYQQFHPRSGNVISVTVATSQGLPGWWQPAGHPACGLHRGAGELLEWWQQAPTYLASFFAVVLGCCMCSTWLCSRGIYLLPSWEDGRAAWALSAALVTAVACPPLGE